MDWATIVLDILTFLLVIASFIAIYVNRKQTQEAIKESQTQSSDALAEGRKQSQEALAVAREQIEQGKRPILIPLSPLPLTAVTGELDSTTSELSIDLKNVGTGVALNIWGVVVRPDTMKQLPYAFSNQSCLLQDEKDTICFRIGKFFLFSDDYKIGDRNEKYTLWPSSELTEMPQGGNAKRLRYAGRLTLTYIDVFGIKHASIHDLTCDNEWKFVKNLRILLDLEDIYKDQQNNIL